MSAHKPFAAAVVGLGNIGYRFDKQGGTRITTHAKAFAEHSGFALVAGVDNNPEACADFNAAYQLPTYTSLSRLFAEQAIDIVALAVPTSEHFNYFQQAMAFKPKAILCEKPIASNSQQAQAMLAQAQAQGVFLAVNYIRPYEPATAAMIKRIKSQAFGDIQKGCVRYVKGLANNASHYINLLLHIWGKPDGVEVITAGNPQLADPEPDFVLRWGGNRIYFLALDERYYSVSEFELWGSAGAVYYRNMGREIVYADVAENTAFTGYKSLHLQQTQTTDLMRYQWYSADYVYHQLVLPQPDYSSAEMACATLEVVEQIIAELGREATCNN